MTTIRRRANGITVADAGHVCERELEKSAIFLWVEKGTGARPISENLRVSRNGEQSKRLIAAPLTCQI